MNTLKKFWISPKATLEEFTPNEYVSSCWGVGCNVTDANTVEASWPGHKDESHTSNHCGLAGNQVIYDDDNNGTADRMIEVGTDGLGKLTCTIYTDGSYSTKKSVSSVKVGDYIYWTTSASGGRVWHHQGLVTANVPNHPNRS